MKWTIDQEQPQKVTDKQRVLVCQLEVGLVLVSPEKPNLKDVFKVVYGPEATLFAHIHAYTYTHTHL